MAGRSTWTPSSGALTGTARRSSSSASKATRPISSRDPLLRIPDCPHPALAGCPRRRHRSRLHVQGAAMSAETRIKELGIALPPPSKPLGNYVPGVRVGNLLFLSGHGPIRIEGNPSARGKVGRDLSTEDAYKVARDVGLNLLGSARALLGSLDRVKRVVKVLGMVNAVESFGEQPKV